MAPATRAERPYWYETTEGIFCQGCRAEALRNWSPEVVRDMGGNEDEVVRPRDFTPLGRTPWSGNPPGDRYMQCDGCNGQWGPDA